MVKLRSPTVRLLFSSILILLGLASNAWIQTPIVRRFRNGATRMAAENYSNQQQIRVLGVCGGIGSGKSAACKLLVSELNCLAHIEADSIAHGIYEPGSQAIEDVVREFGDDLLLETGEIDRKKLASIVFADPEAMRKLELIVWPHVQQMIESRIQDIVQKWDGKDGKRPVIVVEAAVLLDAEWQTFLDAVWVVSASRQVATERLVSQRGFTKEEAIKRIDAQKSRRGIGNLEKEVENNVVSAIIENNGGLDDLKRALEEKLRDKSCWYREEAAIS